VRHPARTARSSGPSAEQRRQQISGYVRIHPECGRDGRQSEHVLCGARAACGVWRVAQARRGFAAGSPCAVRRGGAGQQQRCGARRAHRERQPSPLLRSSLPPCFAPLRSSVHTQRAGGGGRGVLVDHDHARTRREAPPPPELTAPRGLEGSGQVLTAPIEPRYPARFHLSPHRSPVRGGRRQGQELTGDGAHWTSAVVFLFRSFFSFSFLFFFSLFLFSFSFSFSVPFSLFLFPFSFSLSLPRLHIHNQPTNNRPRYVTMYVAARQRAQPAVSPVQAHIPLLSLLSCPPSLHPYADTFHTRRAVIIIANRNAADVS